MSSVNVSPVAGPVFPAASVCRTATVFTPSTAVKLPPHVAPPSTEYSTAAPASIPVSASVPSWVTRSAPPGPVSANSPTPGAAGASVSIATFPDVAVPDPAFPATSVTPPRSTVTTFAPDSTPAAGVSVAVHVTPPSAVARFPSTPLPTATSARLNPVTASVKVIVTVAVSPIRSAASSTATVAAGAAVSSVNVSPVAGPVFPAASVCRTATVFTPSTAVKLPPHVAPPSTEYSTTAPASTPNRLKPPACVTRSVPLAPVSVASVTTGPAGAAVSSVNVSPVTPLTFPAASVCRTATVFTPSTAVKLPPHVAPPSTEYSTTAPASTPNRLKPPACVTRSVPLAPVSVASVTTGPAGAAVSSVNVSPVTPLTFPAASVCRTATVFTPSTAVKLPPHVAPPSTEYSTAAPASIPVSASVPSWVTRSAPPGPVSANSPTPGAAGASVSML